MHYEDVVFADDDEQKHSVRGGLERSSKEFQATGLASLKHRWKKCVGNEGDFVEE
jgi:hypothetical protein